MRAVGNFLGLLRHASRRERTHLGGNAVSGSAVSPFNVVNKAHPDVLVDRAPVGQDIHSVAGRVGFACADFQRSRAHWAQGRGFRQLHDCLHASQQPDPARATRRESMSGRASHRSNKKYICPEIIENKVFSLFVRLDGWRGVLTGPCSSVDRPGAMASQLVSKAATSESVQTCVFQKSSNTPSWSKRRSKSAISFMRWNSQGSSRSGVT
jgi:hypothetical protein